MQDIDTRIGKLTFTHDFANGYRDSDGDFLSGSKSYRLHVPANVPVVNYWSLAYYDADTRSLLDSGQWASISSNGNLKLNADGWADVFFGPTAPKDPNANWMKTIPGRGYFGGFRFYGPTQAFFDKAWKPGDIENGRIDATAMGCFSLDETTDVGEETGTAVAEDCQTPNRFNGKIRFVQIGVGLDDKDHFLWHEEQFRIAMARQ